MYYVFFFFFQAEDGIRDADVTGVQTCALPISTVSSIGLRAVGLALASIPAQASASPPKLRHGCSSGTKTPYREHRSRAVPRPGCRLVVANPSRQKTVSSAATRHRQSNTTLGAAAPLAFQVETVICRSSTSAAMPGTVLLIRRWTLSR